MQYVEGYELLANILTDAYEQSATGKGRERHGLGAAWHDQPIFTLGREFGIGGTAFQAAKKLREACKMAERGEHAAAEREILGTIVYAAATIGLIREMAAKVPHDRAGKMTQGVTQAIYDASRGIARDTVPAAPADAPTSEPIPAGIFWDDEDATGGNFRDNNGTYQGTNFEKEWGARRDEFPKWTPAAPADALTSEPVPENVFWKETYDYDSGFRDASGKRYDEDFRDKWWGRREEFPKYEDRPAPSGVRWDGEHFFNSKGEMLSNSFTAEWIQRSGEFKRRSGS